MMDTFSQDLRIALRKLGKSPGFLAVALVSLALGIGANATVFSLIDAVLLRPLPVPEPERLVSVYASRAGEPYRSSTFADYVDYATADVFSGLAATAAWEYSMAADDTSRLVAGELVSANYFEVLGVPPTIGRGLAAAGNGSEALGTIAVISHSLWRKAFGGDPEVIGKGMRLNGHPFSIAGVAPEGFSGPSLGSRTEIWVPLDNYPTVATGFWSHFQAVDYDEQRGRGGNRIAMWDLIGRLSPGVSLDQARAALVALDHGLAERYPETNTGQAATLVPAAEAATPLASRGDAMRFMLLLGAAVGAALLIACTNLANLLLARADHRRREIGIRLAVGANRGRLVRQLLTESLVLATLGGGAGLLMTSWAFDLLAPFRLPGGIAIGELGLRIDPAVVGFTLGASLLTGLLFGLAPALVAARNDPQDALEDRASNLGPTNGRFQDTLIAVQVGLSVVLLVAAGLFARSLQRGLTADLGFDPRGTLTMTFDLGLERYDEARAQVWYSELLERTRAQPEVRNASVTSSPFGQRGFGTSGLSIEGRGRVDSERITLAKVDAEYFQAMDITLLAGRGFDARDVEGGPRTVIINQTMARTFFPDASDEGLGAVGQQINFARPDAPYFEIAGVVADSRYWSLTEGPQHYVYMPLAQHWSHAAGNEATLIVRTDGEPWALAGPIGDIVRQLDPNVPIASVATLHDRLAETLMPQRMGTAFLSFFGLMALALASIGIFGVVAYAAGRRTREIGLRVALGAAPRAVASHFMRRGLTPVVLGLALGLAAAAVVTRLLAAFLYRVVPLDPAAFVTAAAILLATAAAACWLPARAASKIDPIAALHHE